MNKLPDKPAEEVANLSTPGPKRSRGWEDMEPPQSPPSPPPVENNVTAPVVPAAPPRVAKPASPPTGQGTPKPPPAPSPAPTEKATATALTAPRAAESASPAPAGQGTSALTTSAPKLATAAPPAPNGETGLAPPVAGIDTKAVAKVIRERLRDWDPEYGKTKGKGQVGILLTRSADRQLDLIRHRFGIDRTEIYGAAVAVWLKAIEGIVSLPVDRSQVSAILPSAADRVMNSVLSFRDEECVAINARMQRIYDAKLSNLAYLLNTVDKRVGKRYLIGSAVLKILDELTRWTGPLPVV